MCAAQIRAVGSTSVDRQLGQLQEQLEAVHRHLSQAQRLVTMGTLAAGVAHEINNILTPVLSYAHVARSAPDDQELRQKAFDKIISGVESACQIVQAVLNFGQDPEEEAVADVAEVLGGAMACLARDPAKDGIELALGVPVDTTVRIRPLALQQVLLNLILNATEALRDRRGARITVDATVLGDSRLSIIVSDNGPGIPPDMLDQIFQAYFSTKRSSVESSGGSGLGLMVSRHLVEHAGGTITVASEPDTGTTFTITLPAG